MITVQEFSSSPFNSDDFGRGTLRWSRVISGSGVVIGCIVDRDYTPNLDFRFLAGVTTDLPLKVGFNTIEECD